MRSKWSMRHNEILLSLTGSRKSIGEFIDRVHMHFEEFPWHVRDTDESRNRLIKLSAHANYYRINYRAESRAFR